MKLTKEQINYMTKEITKVLKANPDLPAQYLSGNFPHADRTKNLQKRFLFDLFYMANLTSFFYGLGVNDDHIFTGLRRVAKILNLEEVK